MQNQPPSLMDPDRWQKLEDLYYSALPLDKVSRLSLLEQSCGEDESLISDVFSLLESSDRTDSFMEEPALSFGLTVIRLESDALLGTNLGRYRILKTLGHGGMGEVYLAQDPRLNRNVALKLLPVTITEDRERVLRFEQEARAASAISHPNVAHIYEIGEDEGRHYLTMEYIKGPTLRHILRKRILPPERALEIAIQVASALSAAHRAGIIHRDIKPENILLHEDGFVKVLDFGLAKLIENRTSETAPDDQYLPSLHTEPQLFMGTSHYMSPEQVRRQPVDLRTDLWSLAIVIYEMLTFRRPFKGDRSEVIVEIIEKEPELTNLELQLPREAQVFLSRALRKLPAERYQSAYELLVDLRKLKAAVSQTSPPSTTHNFRMPVDTEVRWHKHKPAKEPTVPTFEPIRSQTIPQRFDTVLEVDPLDRRSIFSIVSRKIQLALVAVLVITTGAYFGLVRRSPATLASRPINLRFERLNLSGNISDITLSPDGKYVAGVVIEQGKYTIHITELATASDLRVGTPSDQGYSGLSFSPDGIYLYYLENHTYTGTLFRVSKLGGGHRMILSNVSTPVSFSADGSQIAFTRVNNIAEPADLIIAQADGTSERVLAKRTLSDQAFFFSDMNGPGPAWSPDGETLAFATRTATIERVESNVEMLDVKTGTGRRLNSKPWHNISGIKWFADGSGIVIVAKESPRSHSQLWFISYPTGQVTQVTNDPNDYTRISSSFDSGLFLTLNAVDDSNLWVVSLDEGQHFSPRILGQKKGISEVVWKPDGNLICVVYDGLNSNLWMEDARGESARQLTFGSTISRRPVASPDGRYVVFVSSRNGSPNVWRMDNDGAQLKQLTYGPNDDMPSVTPDGAWVIYRTGSTIAKVPISGGKATTLLEVAAFNPVVSPNGRLVAFFTADQFDSARWHLEVYDLATLVVVKRFELPKATDPMTSLRWIPSGEGLTFISAADSTSNLWLQSLTGAAPRRLTDFRDAEIQSFSWSPDGKHIMCVRRAKTQVPLLVRLF